MLRGDSRQVIIHLQNNSNRTLRISILQEKDLPNGIGIKVRAGSLSEESGWRYKMLRAVPAMFIFTIAAGMLYVSSVSYLGFGITPPSPELGVMMSGSGRTYMLQAPWMVYWPALVLAFLLFV